MNRAILYLAPDSEIYRQTIFDVIRIFWPDFQWAETLEGEAFLVHLKQTGQTWMLQMGEMTSTFSIESLDENQRRRMLKQQVYRMMQKWTGDIVHPWGIMTGVRPTKIVHRYLDEGQTPEELRGVLQSEYLMAQEKTELLLEVAMRQRPILLDCQSDDKKVSIYLSIPFCPTRCSYCSFPSFALPKSEVQELYLDNLLMECKAIGQVLREKQKQVQTIYIGGGTPTSLSVYQLERLLNGVQCFLGSDALQEFTVEAGRPDTITAEKLQLLHDYQVGRISINPQTFSQRTLDAIGRQHTVQRIYDVYKMARQIGFDSINMDLITGLAEESIEEFVYSLEQIAKLQPENLTIHTLAIKRTARVRLNTLTEQRCLVVARMHQYLNQWLKKQVYVPYYLYRQKHMVGDQENTGYCLPGKESFYNILMMEERQTILGLGVGSTSKYVNPFDWTLTQSSNPKDVLFYNQRIAEMINRKIEKIREFI